MPPKRTASMRSKASSSVSDVASAATTGGRKRGRPAGTSAAAAASPAKKSKIGHYSHNTIPGIVLTVGEGDVGQLGLGPDTMERNRPGVVELPHKCVQVLAGGMHTACLLENGDIYTFGCNDEGALGRDTSVEDSEYSPGKLQSDLKFIQISAGDSHTAMLTADGELYVTGTFRDANGSIGLTEKGPEKTPILLACDNKRVVKIASGADHVLALTEEGHLYSVGCAEQGQLGRVAERFSGKGGRKGLNLLLTLQPINFKGSIKNKGPKIVDIWAGTYVSFAKTSSGEVYAWGLNNYYQLGTGDMENKYFPCLSSLAADKDWTCVSAGQHHSVAVNKAGEVYTLGRGTYGQLGLGESTTEDAQEPSRVSALIEQCTAVEASASVSFSLTTDGKAYAWGMGTSKQLSNGEEDDRFEPTLMAGKQINDRLVLMISAGGQHTALLAKDKPDSGDKPPSA